MSCFTENEKVIQYTNGFFDRKFRWNLSAIIPSDSANKNGYLLQNINRKTCASDSFWKRHNKESENYNTNYYEAWEVRNGKLFLTCDYGFDDSWKTAVALCDDITFEQVSFDEAMLFEYIERYETYGEHIQIGYVYWIDSSQTALVNCMKTELKKGKVKSAGELLSANEISFADKLGTPLVHSCSNQWYLQSEEQLQKRVYNCIKRSEINIDHLLRRIDTNEDKEILKRLLASWNE